MKKTNVCYQRAEWYSRRSYFTILNSLLLIFLYSGQAVAAAVAPTCQTATITASTPTADFVVNANGTVTHRKTGLTWKRCSEGQAWSGTTCTGSAITVTWQSALQQAQTLNSGGGYAGFTDWRLPNQKELGSIMESQCVTPSINVTIFPATVINWYWSASPYAGNATVAWDVHFGNGNIVAHFKTFNDYVRLVRGGQ